MPITTHRWFGVANVKLTFDSWIEYHRKNVVLSMAVTAFIVGIQQLNSNNGEIWEARDWVVVTDFIRILCFACFGINSFEGSLIGDYSLNLSIVMCSSFFSHFLFISVISLYHLNIVLQNMEREVCCVAINLKHFYLSSCQHLLFWVRLFSYTNVFLGSSFNWLGALSVFVSLPAFVSCLIDWMWDDQHLLSVLH